MKIKTKIGQIHYHRKNAILYMVVLFRIFMSSCYRAKKLWQICANLASFSKILECSQKISGIQYRKELIYITMACAHPNTYQSFLPYYTFHSFTITSLLSISFIFSDLIFPLLVVKSNRKCFYLRTLGKFSINIVYPIKHLEKHIWQKISS